jgi:hypothetical protein
MTAGRKGLRRGAKYGLKHVTQIRLKGVTHYRVGNGKNNTRSRFFSSNYDENRQRVSNGHRRGDSQIRRAKEPCGTCSTKGSESIHYRTFVPALLSPLTIPITPRIKQTTPITVSIPSLHAMHHPLPSLNMIQPPTIMNQTAITRLNIFIFNFSF